MKRPLDLLLWIVLALGALTLGHSHAAQEGLEEFVPTERLPADSAISFPVDI
ncbi:MAG: hypothetical protein R3325_11060 [Thermoanaerobaculia bacterium]|nr:hypothetical protein [Thermoanaerobaculia bacterium]